MGFWRRTLNKFKPGGSGSKEGSSNDPERAAFNINRDISLHNSVCFAPSVNMIFSENGTIKACCHNSENSLGTYPQNSIAEIWNSTEAQRFRNSMKSYHFLSGCGVCERDYKQGNFNEMPAHHFDNLPRHAAYPTMMEFMLSNTCNLECVMCSGELSSSIRRNRDKLPPIESPYDDEFLNQLKDFMPYLTETRFSSSGEAFLIDMNFRLWEMLIESNPSCQIVVQTNGTVLNSRVKDFLKRGNFKIGVSLDSLQKQTFEAIRVNASFEKVMQNIEYFAAYCTAKKERLTISTCVMRQNWKELPDFVTYCNKLGAYATFHKVWAPLEFAIHNLPADQLHEIYNELSAYKFPLQSYIEKKNSEHYYYFVSLIGTWAQAAENNSSNENFAEYGLEELMIFVKQKFKAHVSAQSMLEENTQALAMMCENKIDGVMGLCNSDEQRKQRLISLASIPVQLSFPAIKNNSTEKLFEMSGVSHSS